MSHTTENNILLQLTGKQTVADVPVDELIALTQQYPAFGAAQFLLAKKTQKDAHAGKDKYAQTAALHFANPYWFHFKLNEEDLMEDAVTTSQPAAKEEPAEDIEEIIIQGLEETLGQADATDTKDDVTVTEEEHLAEQPAAEASVEEEAGETPTGTTAPGVIAENATTEDEVREQSAPEGTIVETAGENVTEINEAVIEDDIAGGQADSQSGDDAIVTSLPEAEKDIDVATDEHPGETGVASVQVSTEVPGAGPGDDEESSFEDADSENEALMPGLADSKISSVLQEQMEAFKKPVAADAPVPIESEPYHTIDYFASQGIKLSAELQKQDHLAVKVKKFTDWLKQMKRINPTPADLGIDEATEHKVQDSAASSNEAKEVVTETMAEVLAMQGMKEKAIQVYIKLSFLDPSKTAYFASKIEQLKGM